MPFVSWFVSRAGGDRRSPSRALSVLLVTMMSGLCLGAAPPDATLEVVVSAKGFRPATLQARKGESLRLRLTSSDHEHCFAIDELRVEKRVVPGRATILEITPDRPGSFAYYCCLENGADAERGVLVVAE